MLMLAIDCLVNVFSPYVQMLNFQMFNMVEYQPTGYFIKHLGVTLLGWAKALLELDKMWLLLVDFENGLIGRAFRKILD
jgi:hypothetical protein